MYAKWLQNRARIHNNGNQYAIQFTYIHVSYTPFTSYLMKRS